MLTHIRQTIRSNYLQPAFLVCVGVLATAAITVSALIKLSGIYLTKEPLPLKKPFTQLDISKLAPYTLSAKSQIDNPDVLENLGTEDYLQWTLEDTTVPADSDVRFCTLFVTYYGLPDKVPHVPEECYIGGGFRRITSEAVALKINQGGSQQQISAHYIVFAVAKPDAWLGEIAFPVLYTFSVNGEYAGARGDVRLILNKNLFGRFSYFSKVEWKFYNSKFGRAIYPDKQAALAASEKLLAVILPILEKEHWPSEIRSKK
jgi:hypothetical protein